MITRRPCPTVRRFAMVRTLYANATNDCAVTLADKAVVAWWPGVKLVRRNVTPEQASYLRGKRYNMEKVDHGGDRKSKDQNDLLNGMTADRLADEFKVSAPTIKREQMMVDMRKDGMSYRKIGEAVGVNATTAMRVVESAGVAFATPAITGADGKQYPAKQERKSEPPQRQP